MQLGEPSRLISNSVYYTACSIWRAGLALGLPLTGLQKSHPWLVCVETSNYRSSAVVCANWPVIGLLKQPGSGIE